MKSQRPSNLSAKRPAGGFTLIEATIATLVLAIVLAGAMQVAATSATLQSRSAQRATARFLANALASDIERLAYTGVNNAPFGLGPGESPSSKVNYDDVDDFDGWTESPPQDRNGVAIPGMEGYRRSVSVKYVSASNLSQTSASETGVKRVTVTVTRGNATLATRVFVRTNAP